MENLVYSGNKIYNGVVFEVVIKSVVTINIVQLMANVLVIKICVKLVMDVKLAMVNVVL